MAAVLFLVGAAREPPQVVEQMLRVSEWQRKPQYAMASEGPLLLAHCAFQGLTFHTSPRAAATVRAHLNGMLHSSLVQSAMLRTIHSSVAPTDGDQIGSTSTSHVPLHQRPTEPTYEERREKLSRSRKHAVSIAPNCVVHA
eukprot:jgi/Mesen1/10311/ME000079S09728